jgi:hypothetical protein
MNQEVRLTLLQLLEDRYGKKSIIVTSQLPVAKWYEYINAPTLANAILDRLTVGAHRIELKGESPIPWFVSTRTISIPVRVFTSLRGTSIRFKILQKKVEILINKCFTVLGRN